MQRPRLLLAALLAGVVSQAVPRGWGVNIDFDYTYDTSSFFSGANVGRRAYLELAASVFESRMLDTFSAIAPSGGNSWTWTLNNPATGSTVTLSNPSIEEDTIRVYIGARDLPGGALGYGGGVGYSYQGATDWNVLIAGRNKH